MNDPVDLAEGFKLALSQQDRTIELLTRFLLATSSTIAVMGVFMGVKWLQGQEKLTNASLEAAKQSAAQAESNKVLAGAMDRLAEAVRDGQTN